jgi:PAS domain S-box-containing protein
MIFLAVDESFGFYGDGQGGANLSVVGETGFGGLNSRELVWDTPRANGHSVQFYEDDFFLIDALSRFIGTAIVAGDSAVVIATRSHRDALSSRLLEGGLDLIQAAAQGRFVSLDAAETLAKFTVDGQLDPARFTNVMGNLIAQLSFRPRRAKRRVAAFGEMVALLWLEGKPDAAIQLEQLWNDLARTHSFELHCAYPIHLFAQEQDSELVRQICAKHSHVVPAEPYTGATNDEERLQTVVVLQHKAQALETEIRERKKIQQALQEREAELSDFLENAVIGIHWVAADGTILWANKAELSLLGFERHEYIGHHISEFHADASVIDDILQRVNRNEEIHCYEARLRCKDGSIRHVRIDSNVFMRDGKFAHTRCFTTDITDKKRADEASLRLAAIVEFSDDAIISKDLKGIITSWNNGAERIFGYKAEEIIGRPITLIIPAELQDEEFLIQSKIKSGARIDHFETVRLHKKGTGLMSS